MHDKALRIKAWPPHCLFDAVNPEMAGRAARLIKADVVTGLVGEFPELRGIIGGYYAGASGEIKAVSRPAAITVRKARVIICQQQQPDGRRACRQG